MDIEKLIERLRSYTYWLGQDGPESHDIHPLICDEAADAISTIPTLQAENAQLRAELSRKEELVRRQAKELERRDKLLKEQEAELEQVKRERDSAIESWRGFCAKCTWNGKQYLADGQMDARCKTCRETGKCNWEWRGPKED